MNAGKQFLQSVQTGQVWRAGDHLKHAPANDGFSIEDDGAASFTQRDPITPAQQVAEIRSDQESIGGAAGGII